MYETPIFVLLLLYTRNRRRITVVAPETLTNDDDGRCKSKFVHIALRRRNTTVNFQLPISEIEILAS